MSDHRRIERQIAAMHRVIAERIRAGDAAPMRIAHENLARWQARFGGELPPAYDEWRKLLALGVSSVLAVMEGETEDDIRRRSSSPFAGVLTPSERWEILERAA